MFINPLAESIIFERILRDTSIISLTSSGAVAEFFVYPVTVFCLLNTAAQIMA